MYQQTEKHLGVPVEIKIESDLSESDVLPYFSKVFRVFEEFERHLSITSWNSEISRLNRQRGKPTVVSEGLFELLSFCLLLADKSGGSFDPCVIDYLDAYGYYTDNRPNMHAIRALKNRRSSFREVTLVSDTRTVQLLPSQRIDLSAVLKGYIVDLTAQILLVPFQNFSIDAGGDMLVFGSPSGEENWKVTIKNPFEDIGGYLTIGLTNKGIATTTSVGEGSVMIINPKTGAPVYDLVSVTVIAPSAMRADSLATTAFALGLHKGLALLEQESNVEGMVITPDKTVLCTTGMKNYFINNGKS